MRELKLIVLVHAAYTIEVRFGFTPTYRSNVKFTNRNRCSLTRTAEVALNQSFVKTLRKHARTDTAQ